MSQGSRKSQEDGLKGMLSAMGVVVFIAFMKFTPVVLFGMLHRPKPGQAMKPLPPRRPARSRN